MKNLKVIVSGGGTGGHIFPAIAIANAIKALRPDAEILFVGAEGRMEMEKVPAAGYKIVGLWISGFQRRLTFDNITFFFKLISSLMKAKKIIKEFKPDVVVGTGGYASGPMLRIASRSGIPTLIQEQNSYPGITNKLLAKRVNKICVAYKGMERFFPKDKIIMTGNPVRQDILDVQGKREKGLGFFGLDGNKKTVLVIGGSLGARTINESIGASVEEFAKNNIQLIWQTGKAYFETAKAQTKNCEAKGIKAFDFISKMDLVYAVADIVISRAGASSVSELCLVKKPAILVPSPNVAEDHQTKNVMALIEHDAAILVKDIDAKQKLVATAIELMNDNNKQEKLRVNIAKLAFQDSANVISKEVLALVKKQ